MAAAKDKTPEEPLAPAGVADPTLDPDEWVSVVLKGEKDMPPGLMPRAYYEGWGKDKGWVEAK